MTTTNLCAGYLFHYLFVFVWSKRYLDWIDRSVGGAVFNGTNWIYIIVGPMTANVEPIMSYTREQARF